LGDYFDMVYNCALSKGLDLNNYNSARRQWTSDEDAYLEEAFATTTFEGMAQHLNRSLGSVTSRCGVLRLSKMEIRKQNSLTVEGARGTISHPKPGVTVHIGRYGKRTS
jgi:hypothetical protein